jgi:hypothetical protein
MLVRTIQRLLILALGAVSIWLIVFVVFRITNNRLPWILALVVTYAAGAYLILPYALRMGLKILQRQHVPRYTLTGDGLPGDPVNLVLVGTLDQLRAAFAAAGWHEADRLGLRSSLRMARKFITNRAYPTAPFSTLYLFGRGQDVGFQKPIGNSPRKRHHVRFWALSLSEATGPVTTARFWLNQDRPPLHERVLWVGAGTCDTGFGLTRLTFKITHATDADTNAERDFIISELASAGAIEDQRRYQTGSEIEERSVNHYITDGEVTVARLRDPMAPPNPV